ncbi:MAG: hypothetical protein PHR28_12965 [candidate division Zixibacteria bacterium]|jgi:hypothetical protein|nr:hypothetical protein [candidate division Zixibacteria bacterium]
MGYPGLDSIWIMPDRMIHPFFDHDLRLMADFHDRRWTTFRGEQYTDFIEQVSGITLRQPSMIWKDVCTIADALAQHTLVETDRISPQEFDDLRIMFWTYAICGATLIAW